jgi:uncharacterized protein
LSIAYIGVAFFLGLAGSLHCILMCGPFVLSTMNRNSEFSFRILFDSLEYHFGRIFIYVLLGVLIGVFGRGLHFMKLTPIISILCGVYFLILGFKVKSIEHYLSRISFFNSVSKRLSYFFQLKKFQRPIFWGIINGFIPCGLLYSALVGALSSTSVIEGGVFMMFFGLGTAPLLVIFQVMNSRFQLKSLLGRKLFQSSLFILSGILLIYRGLFLKVDWLYSIVPKAVPDCH